MKKRFLMVLFVTLLALPAPGRAMAQDTGSILVPADTTGGTQAPVDTTDSTAPVVTPSTSQPVTGSGSKYHAPQTAAEQALDHVIRADVSAGNVFTMLNAQRPGYSAGAAAQYAGLFTPQLVTAVTDADWERAQSGCGGDYTKGICGLNYDPLLCALNHPDIFQYRTISATAQQVFIAYAWDKNTADTAIYKLINKNGIWQIDGIDCSSSGLDKFNM